eukprot:Phypoly_transcript_08756.p1 GENE.Phypoly_transcript_08756~~Phypoly_transcript_08756.p1  ORF type:complete len:270 (+),score=58.24 Phypoly_transcript_08756:425-1234(+)
MDPLDPLTPSPSLLDRVHELEQEVQALRHRNEELYAAQQYIHHQQQHNAIVSPLVLSPSSIPPSEDNPKSSKEESEVLSHLTDQLKLKDEKIHYLEQNVAMYKKKLEQTESLLYDLQWDPMQDIAVCQLGGDQVAQLLEKKMAQLIEQMRIMEKGLREKQVTIDKLSDPTKNLNCNYTNFNNYTHFNNYANTIATKENTNINDFNNYNIHTSINNYNNTDILSSALTPPLNQAGLLLVDHTCKATTADELISTLNGVTLIPIASQSSQQ